MNDDHKSFHSKIWIIVPLLKHQEKEISSFTRKHNFLNKKNIFLLFKISDNNRSLRINKDERIHHLYQQDSSIYEAWNQALSYLSDQLLEHDYITFLGLDDQWSEDFFNKANSVIEHQKPSVDFIYGNSIHSYGNKIIKRISPTKPTIFGKNNFSFDVPHPGMLNRWKIISSLRFDTNLQLAADLDFYIRVSLNNDIVYHYLRCTQATLGAEGISNGPNSKTIYLSEWKIIESKHGIKLRIKPYRTKLLAFISKWPKIFTILRKFWWSIHPHRIK